MLSQSVSLKTKLEVVDLSLTINQKKVLNNVNFNVFENELVTLLGKSGSGKSMILKLICGFMTTQSGQIRLDGQDISQFAINQRKVAIVDQDLHLFEHMTVYDNVAFGLKMKGVSKAQIKGQVLQIMDEMQLQDHLNKYPSALSGGQKQRVAIARSLVINPSLLLLDEPFSKLDKSLRLEIHDVIRQLRKQHDISIVLVTHDHEEAMYLSDRIVIINDGEVVQFDTAKTIYYHPKSLVVSQLFPDRIYLNSIQSRFFNLQPIDHHELISLRREQLSVVPYSEFLAKVVDIQFLGREYVYTVSINNIELTLLSNDIYQLGDQLYIEFSQELERFIGDLNVRYSC